MNLIFVSISFFEKVVGAAFSGRSAIIRRYILNLFTSEYQPTFGVDISSHKLGDVHASKVDNEIWVHFWNIAYPELRGKHLNSYLKDANAAIVVFDSTDLKSVQAVDEWRLIFEQLQTNSDGRKSIRRASKPTRQIPMILLANKCDLGKSVIKPGDLDVYSKKCGYMNWHFTSARYGDKVKQSIDSLIESLVDQIAYQKLEDKCNRKLSREQHKRLSATINSFTTQSLYDGMEPRKSSRSSSPILLSENDTQSEVLSSLSSSPNRSELDFDAESLSLRDLETKGNNFFLELANVLSNYMTFVDAERQKDIEMLENQRVKEYGDFKRKFLEVANCVVNFSSETSFESKSPNLASIDQNSHVQIPDDGGYDMNNAQTIRLFSELNVQLIEANRRWRKVLDQLETEMSLTSPLTPTFDRNASPDPLLRSPSKSSRTRSPGMNRNDGLSSSSFRMQSQQYDEEYTANNRLRHHSQEFNTRVPRGHTRRISEDGNGDAVTVIKPISTLPRHKSLGFGFRNSRVGKPVNLSSE